MPILPNRLDISEVGQFQDITDPADPETDLSASQYNKLSAVGAALSETAIRAAIRVDSAGDLQEAYAVWKNPISTIYTANNNVGDFSVTFSSTVEDLQGNIQSLNLFAAIVQLNGATPLMTSVNRISGTNFQILLADENANPADKGFWVFFL